MKRLTPEQARARLHPQGKKKAKGQQKLQFIGSIGHAEEDIYLFDGPDGGVATPADEGLPPILGVWEAGGEIPPAMKDWLQEYAAEVEWWQNIGENLQADSPAKAKANASPRQSIAPMITTKWSQKAPYNDKIVFEGKKCPTGCNTTATAQIMYYWGKKGYQRGCKATEDYVTETNGYEVKALPPLTLFDYKNLTKTPKTAEQKKAVQQMMQYVAYTFHSDFKPKSTGAAPKQVATYLRDKLRMGSMISYITAVKVGLASFENYIYNELLNGRPVIVAGWTGTGGGHTFIIDGYDVETDMYHVNWGWGGSYDGWFKLSALNPKTSVAFNSNKAAIIGIQPDYKWGDVNDDGEVDITDVMQVVQDAQDGKYSERADVNNDGEVTVTDAMVILDKVLGRTYL